MKKYINKIIISIGALALIVMPTNVFATVNTSYGNIQYFITVSNNPPVVNAGPDLSVQLASPASSTSVSATGNATDDISVATMTWSQLSGPVSATIVPPSLNPGVTPASLVSNFRNLSIVGDYFFCLDATDGPGLNAVPDCMKVTVLPAALSNIDLVAGITSPGVASVGISAGFSSVISNIGTDSTGISFSNFFQVATSTNGGGTITDLAYTTMSALAGGLSDVASASYTFPSAGTYSMRACADKSSSGNSGTVIETDEGNNCESWTNVVVTPPVLQAPIILFSATGPIVSGQSARLSWTTTNATSCDTLSGPWLSYGPRPINSVPPGEDTGPLTIQTTYVIQCNGPGGTSTAPATVYITVNDPLPPEISYFRPFSCVAGGGKFGSSPRFAWNSAHTTSCKITRTTVPEISETVAISSELQGGSLESDGLYYYLSNLPVIGSSSDYTLQCFNGIQFDTEYAAVNTCSPDFTLGASPILRSFVNGNDPVSGNPGKIATYTISVNPAGGFGSDVDLSIQSEPGMPLAPDTTFTFVPSTLDNNSGAYNTSTLTIWISDAAFPTAGGGTVYTPIVIQGIGGGFTRTVTIGADATGKKIMKYREPNN